jgi:hypothetical protein
MSINFITLLELILIGLGFYLALIGLSAWYARVTGWQPPSGNQTNDWALRRRLGFALGALAVVVCAVGASLWQATWLSRLLIMLQAALLASAGASDMQRFQLPLPLTLLGMAVAVLTLALMPIPTFYLLFGLMWVLVLILLHTFVSKGSMQLGDHIATIWIALVSPVNGLVAIALGDAANVIFARVKGLRGKKVAAAGAWLIIATMLVATPPYFAWFVGPAQAQMAPNGQLSAPIAISDSILTQLPTPVPKRGDIRLTHDDVVTATLLLNLADWAGQHTANVAFASTHAGRVAMAQKEADQVKYFADVAQQVAPGSDVKVTLDDLAAALKSFDLEGVRNASSQLAEERERLKELTATVVLTDTD